MNQEKSAGLALYGLLVRVAGGLIGGSHRVWSRNSLRAGVARPFVSDIDLTIDCRDLSARKIKTAVRRYRLLRRLVPVFGEANWLHPGALEFLGKYGNPVELARDPVLLTLLGGGPRQETHAERAVFLFRMLVADLHNLRRRPLLRRRKWELHFKACRLPLSDDFSLNAVVSRLGDFLAQEAGISCGDLLERPSEQAASLIGVHFLEWLTKALSDEGFPWAIRRIGQMNAQERELLRAQLLWELSYLCLGEARTDAPALAAEHAVGVLSLLHAACVDVPGEWQKVAEAFVDTHILDEEKTSRLMKLSAWPMPSACAAPWRGLSITPSGRGAFCELSKELPVVADPERSVFGSFHSDTAQALRLQMSRGILPLHCQACSDEERAGVRSLRMELNQATGIHRGFVEFDRPRIERLQLSVGAKCRLACISCGPNRSSAWARLTEGKPAHGCSVDLHRSPGFDHGFRRILPELSEITLEGGSVLGSASHDAVLGACIAEGHAERIALAYRICDLADPLPFFERWKRFRSVRIVIWLDGNYEKEPYVRYPSGWEEMRLTLQRWDHSPENISVELGYSVHALSVFYLPQFCIWLRGQRFDRIREGRAHRPLLLDYPCEGGALSVGNCPEDLKKAVLDELSRTKLSDLLYLRELERLKAYLGAEGGDPGAVLALCSRADLARGTSFKKALPELASYYR